MITLSRDPGPMRFPLIVNDDGQDILVQVDYDYPGVASTFGWSLAAVHLSRMTGTAGSACEHGETDGTIDCPACGTSASEFIAAASEYLREHVGATADDPGYFTGDA